ncbi:MAG TPA: TIGR00730 family Rossman fold protein [Chlamydiales bacterium]|nr:TIGR00730 family Rossman fold protein [Chlamydiales bacterium]
MRDEGKQTNPDRIAHSFDSWRIFRIMAEFVDGFETMTTLGPSVAIFGSTNTRPLDKKYYHLAEVIAQKIVKRGFGIITGGGPGIMEHANKGAQEAGGKSCGLCINLPHEERPNPFIDLNYELNFRYFFVRKVMFVRYAQAFVVLPGGYGTLDEFFEAITLIQTDKIKPFPVYLVGKEYWKGLLDWLKNTVLANGNIKPQHLDLIRLSDDPDEIADGIEKHYRQTQSLENF